MKTSAKQHGIKNNKLEKLRPIFFKTGLFITLCLVFLAFEYTTEVTIDKHQPKEDFTEEGWKPIATFQDEKPKPQPQKQIEQPKTVNPFEFKIVDNNTEIADKPEVVQNDLNPDKFLVGFDDDDEPTENIPSPPLNFAEEMPYFTDCREIKGNMERFNCTGMKIQEILDKELKIPADVKAIGESFTAYVQFIVNENGEVVNVKVLRSPTKSFEKAVYKAVKKFPRFVPGRQSGHKQSVIIQQPIHVKILP